MSVITEFTVPADEFVLADAFRAAPEITVELERIVPTQQRAFPLFFAWDCSRFDAFEAAARSDSAIDELTLIDELRDGRLYRAAWSEQTSECRRVLLETGVTLLHAVGSQDEWWFELRFPDADRAAAFQAAAREYEVPFALETLSELTAMESGTQFGLTLEQRETVISAYEAGYFEEPRGVTLTELAEMQELSPGAVSGRLRRGLAQLIDQTLITRG